ncbi:M10 family metallopeptidase C-terminal domain-containing protein [Acinetobacter baumannii]|uniref:M10 family metallopeptidase C-terminal domain-containing protein n=1 Tax=Acinetobacter baumannii TaxID=470 RepID=UPI000928DE0B|nr:M10 family metallopeptidase C-terminal domain-containing protein [Acinetobacter baumannii]MDH2623772.1 M10 family metallopeptidase C-terminal domain-containing protein [Acinetobacter baumannii]OJK08583.1 type I secretion protein [Acinetobacter baumannii]
MVTYGNDQNGLWLKFDNFTSNDIRQIEYINNVLYVTNYSGTYYSLNFNSLAKARMIFSDGVEKQVLFTSGGNGLNISTANNEWIVGTNSVDQMSSGAGNDRLFGGVGDDIYQFSKGDGIDKVTDYSGNNTIQFMASNLADLSIQGNGSNLEVKYSDTDAVLIEGNVSNFKFLDGTTATLDQLLTNKTITLTGTKGNETINGFASNDIINGLEGNDTLNGNAGNDTLNGGAGDDKLYGGTGNDLTVGGTGNDWLASGSGDDTYQFSKGDGNDTINDYSGKNTIQITDVSAKDITFTTNANNELVINYSAMDSITLKAYINNYILSDGVVQTYQQFLTGKTATWNGTDNADNFSGTLPNDVITGGKGNDTLNGREGDDTYRFSLGDGIDTINGDYSGNNTIVFTDIKSTDVQYSFDKTTLNIQYSDSDIVKLTGYLASNNKNFSIQFADGVTIDRAQLDTTVGVNYWVRALVATTNSNPDFKYIFPSTAPDYLLDANGQAPAWWSPFSQAQQDFMTQVYQKASEFSALTFTLTDNASQLNTVAAYRNSTAATAYAQYPSGAFVGSDVAFGPDFWFDPAGTWVTASYPHELGHALGLRHTFEGSTISSFSDEEDTRKWSVMSYDRTGMSYDGSFAPFDVAALQAIYGVNSSARAGNDSYVFDSTKGVLIWDGTGVDTINASNATQAATIDLNQGGWSYIGEKSPHISSANQLSINLGTQIENAIGGAYDDILVGNNLSNRLEGGAGNDTLKGNWGDDVLLGGAGNDTLDGGKGADSLIGGTGDDTYYVDNVGDSIVENTAEGNDKVISDINYTLGDNVENLTLNGTDNLNGNGNALNNLLTGNAGNNNLNGYAGNDTLNGGAGNDTLDGGAGNDTLDGGIGIDTLIGGLGDDTYYVDNVNDVIIEKINEGFETINSTVSYALDSGNALNNLNLLGTDNIDGTGNGNGNTLVGNSGNNVLSGGTNNDVLNGGAGNDILNGGKDNDTLIGGLGSDTALYKLLNTNDVTGGNGADVWKDFKVGNTLTDSEADKIDISELLINYANGSTVNSIFSYLSLDLNGNNSILSIDRDGAGTVYNSTSFLTLNNINTTLNTLWDNHQILV